MIINSKDVIQSYILTTSRYDYTVPEKRILYRMIESFQFLLQGEKLNEKIKVSKDLFGDFRITMPTRSFLNTDDSTNHAQVKKALKKLESKSFEYEDDEMWTIIRIIEKPVFHKNDLVVSFGVDHRVYDALLDFSKGYRKYELKTAFEFNSSYAMRMYELMSGQKQPLTYTIDTIRIMFGVEKKYKLNADFIKRCIENPKKELDKKSPYSFTYKINYLGRKSNSITFYPVFKPESRDENIEQHDLQKSVSVSWDLDRAIINYLKESFFFTDEGIKNNIKLFKEAQQKFDLIYELSLLKVGAGKAKRGHQAFVVGILRNKLKDEVAPKKEVINEGQKEISTLTANLLKKP
jgi:hypothetical protein